MEKSIGLLPYTQRRNRFIFTICDNAIHYPEAIPLPSVEASRVNLLSHIGVPDEILTDQGTNFISNLVEEFISCSIRITLRLMDWRKLKSITEEV